MGRLDTGAFRICSSRICELSFERMQLRRKSEMRLSRILSGLGEWWSEREEGSKEEVGLLRFK